MKRTHSELSIGYDRRSLSRFRWQSKPNTSGPTGVSKHLLSTTADSFSRRRPPPQTPSTTIWGYDFARTARGTYRRLGTCWPSFRRPEKSTSVTSETNRRRLWRSDDGRVQVPPARQRNKKKTFKNTGAKQKTGRLI